MAIDKDSWQASEGRRRSPGKCWAAPPGNIVAIRPLRDGVISDYDTTERMLQGVHPQGDHRFRLFKPRVVICVPSGITEVEERAVVDAGIQAGARRRVSH